MPWMFSSNLYPFHLLWLVSSLCDFWLLIHTTSLFCHATFGSLWCLISKQALTTSFHPPPPLALHNFSQKLGRWLGRYLAVALWGGHVHSFTHCTYTSYIFISLSITIFNCCFPGRLAYCNSLLAFAQRCVPLYWLCRDEKNIWPYRENLCQSPVLLLLASPLVCIVSRSSLWWFLGEKGWGLDHWSQH